jgi:hypothetical protein
MEADGTENNQEIDRELLDEETVELKKTRISKGKVATSRKPVVKKEPIEAKIVPQEENPEEEDPVDTEMLEKVILKRSQKKAERAPKVVLTETSKKAIRGALEKKKRASNEEREKQILEEINELQKAYEEKKASKAAKKTVKEDILEKYKRRLAERLDALDHMAEEDDVPETIPDIVYYKKETIKGDEIKETLKKTKPVNIPKPVPVAPQVAQKPIIMTRQDYLKSLGL